MEDDTRSEEGKGRGQEFETVRGAAEWLVVGPDLTPS